MNGFARYCMENDLALLSIIVPILISFGWMVTKYRMFRLIPLGTKLLLMSLGYNVINIIYFCRTMPQYCDGGNENGHLIYLLFIGSLIGLELFCLFTVYMLTERLASQYVRRTHVYFTSYNPWQKIKLGLLVFVTWGLGLGFLWFNLLLITDRV